MILKKRKDRQEEEKKIRRKKEEVYFDLDAAKPQGKKPSKTCNFHVRVQKKIFFEENQEKRQMRRTSRSGSFGKAPSIPSRRWY